MSKHSKAEGGTSRSDPSELHYGQNHAETVARATAKRHQATAASAIPPVATAPAKGQPIGSTPGAERPGTDDFEGLWSEVQGSFELIGSALHDLGVGAARLLRVPWDAARLARARLPGLRAGARA